MVSTATRAAGEQIEPQPLAKRHERERVDALLAELLRMTVDTMAAAEAAARR
jgi:hypothetical protein